MGSSCNDANRTQYVEQLYKAINSFAKRSFTADDNVCYKLVLKAQTKAIRSVAHEYNRGWRHLTTVRRDVNVRTQSLATAGSATTGSQAALARDTPPGAAHTCCTNLELSSVKTRHTKHENEITEAKNLHKLSIYLPFQFIYIMYVWPAAYDSDLSGRSLTNPFRRILYGR